MEAAMDPEIGSVHNVVIQEEVDNQWTGPLGIARVGDVDVPIKKAKKGQSFYVKITSIGVNQWTNRKQATFEEVEPEAKVGEIYTVVVTEEFENQWTGPLGIAKVGDVRIPIKKAKKGDRFTVQIHEIGTNQWNGQREAKFSEIASDRAAAREEGVDFEIAAAKGQWVTVAPADAIPEGGVKGAKLDGTKIAIAKLDGKLYAVGGVCPHRDGPMAIGRLVGDELECPWHRFRFSVRDGRPTVPVDHPALPCFAVRIEDGQVQVNVPDPSTTPQRPVV
jgi:nitrite reductase (NADH) small subunit/3-phenylpropionate/trans-cinnamate dioxygenase ferredoxin subunit